MQKNEFKPLSSSFVSFLVGIRIHYSPTTALFHSAIGETPILRNVRRKKCNPKKCKELTVHFCRHNEHFPPDLAVTGNALETVEAHKVLGVTIQSNLKWDSRVN